MKLHIILEEWQNIRNAFISSAYQFITGRHSKRNEGYKLIRSLSIFLALPITHYVSRFINGLSLAIVLATFFLTGVAFAGPSTNPNLALEEATQDINAQLPQNSTSIAMIPLSPAQPKLNAISQILTSMLASRFTHIIGDRFVGMNRENWGRFPTDSELLATNPARVKRYGEMLVCEWLVTGQVTQQSNLSLHVNLFLWNTDTGYLSHWANFQLPPSSVLSTFMVEHEPYFRKGLPYRNRLILALEVADVNGDGFNELIITDEKRVKALSWGGFNFREHSHLLEIQYEDDETPVSDRTRRTMLAADRDHNDRDEIYIGQPGDRDDNGRPLNLTWQLEWQAEGKPLVSQLSPIFLTRGEDFFIAAKTAKNQLDYAGKSTVCLKWRVNLSQRCILPVDYHSIATSRPRVSKPDNQVFLVDTEGHLQAYQVSPNATRLIWQTPPLFGEGLAVGDLSGDGVPEIVVTVGRAENHGVGEIYDQFIILKKKDELYEVDWTSPLFEGKIVDLTIGDADNDDQNELILCLRNRQGSNILMYAASD
ncbi:MAG: FG-GAP repeat protein [Candidatus Poribacteria bacterium]